ncbi:semaphorin-4F [Salmo trutta]|uniref:semaphorin-4F n=1 Tax=Salmo trutta TaxID=8032 RepID=UPI0011302DF3|nr:semaphorin-4F-like [Salmo trutta]
MWRAKEGACGPSMTEPIQGQEVEDALKLCDSGEGRCSPILRELRVSVGLHVLLPCVQVSTRPCTWEHPPHRHTRQHHSDLEVTVTEESLGTYTCLCQEGGPGGKEESPACRRASYHLTLEGPSAGGAVAMAGGRHLLAVYILCFILGVALGGFLLFFLSRRRGIGQRHPDHSLSSEKGQDLLGSSATPQSPSCGSLLSEGFPLTEKRGNGTMLLTHGNGNGGHHGNYGVAGGNGGCDGSHGGGHGNAGYANNANCNVQMPASAVNGLKLHVQEMVTDERRGGERERRRPEVGQGDEEDEGLGEGLGGMEEELAGFALFKLPAPLAQCEESSI